jgi:hypothetical protein
MQVFIFVLLLADRTVIENNEAESDSKERLVSVNV